MTTTPTLNERRMLRAAEAARRLGVSEQRVRELARLGRLRAYRIGDAGWLRFDIADLDALLEAVGPHERVLAQTTKEGDPQ